jgi:hypothetical protein
MPGRTSDIGKRLHVLEARKLLSRLLREGAVAFSRHAQAEMEEDDLTEVDIVNTLHCGAVRQGELENGTWRYRVETERMCAVVAFLSPLEGVVVTAWRMRERGR